MKNKDNKPLKVLAGFIAIILIGAMLFTTNAFIGNPISAMKADKDIKQYVIKNYPHLDLEVEKATYDFKNTSYMARAISKTSIDTRFTVYHYKGKVQRDNYKDYVLGMINTLDRLSSEYSAIATNLILNELGYEDINITVIYDKDNYGEFTDDLELDIKFHKALPMNPEVNIQLTLKDQSIEEVAKVLINTHKVFLDNDCIFAKYSLYIEDNDTNIMVVGVTPTHIEGDLLDILEKAETAAGNNEGIEIYRKDEAK